MAYDLEEQESIDQLKAWWEKWGTPVTAVVCIGCLAFAGWNVWNWYQRNQVAKASAVYVSLQNAVISLDQKNIISTSTGLIDGYSSTVYAPLGALNAASAQTKLGDYAAAENLLNWVINSSGRPEYADIAHLRLAAVELSMNKPDEALKSLQAVKSSPSVEVELNDRLGDAYFAKGDYDQAKSHWEKVIKMPALLDENLRNLVLLKLGSIPAKQ